MFTGIVQAIGRISNVSKQGDGLHIAVDTGVHEIADVVVGDSVCLGGCCLTVVAITVRRSNLMFQPRRCGARPDSMPPAT